jgi:hypothetical protein
VETVSGFSSVPGDEIDPLTDRQYLFIIPDYDSREENRFDQ